MTIPITRTANLEDLLVLLEFEQGIIQVERPFDPTLRKEKIHYHDFKAILLDSNAVVVVAEIAGEVIACGYAQIRTAKDYLQHTHYAHLGAMFVREDHRGKGINALIINALMEWVKTKGITEVRLEVYADNLSAIRAYEKLGFNAHLLEMRLGW